MKTKHTPGPWSYTQAFLSSWDIRRPDGTQMYFLGASTSIEKAEHEANARLIAAAPELLEAPVVAHECGRPSKVLLYDDEGIDGWRWTHPDGREWEQVGSWDESEPMHPLVGAAIAKATGEKP